MPRYRRKPIEVTAAQMTFAADGSVDRMFVKNEGTGGYYVATPYGFLLVLPGWWAVNDNDKISVLTDVEFQRQFEPTTL